MLKGSGFPYSPGLNKQSTGTFKKVRGIRVFEDATLELKLGDGRTVTEEFVAGEDVALPLFVEEFTITAGLISMTRDTTA